MFWFVICVSLRTLSLWFQLHLRVIAEHPVLMEEAESVSQQVKESWLSLQTLLHQNLCLLSYIKSALLQSSFCVLGHFHLYECFVCLYHTEFSYTGKKLKVCECVFVFFYLRLQFGKGHVTIANICIDGSLLWSQKPTALHGSWIFLPTDDLIQIC